MSELIVLIDCLFGLCIYKLFFCAGCLGDLIVYISELHSVTGGDFKINALLFSRIICPKHFSTQRVKRQSRVCFASLQIQKKTKNQKQDTKHMISLEIGIASELKASLIKLSC